MSSYRSVDQRKIKLVRLITALLLAISTSAAYPQFKGTENMLNKELVIVELNGPATQTGPFQTSHGQPAETATTATIKADREQLSITFRCSDDEITYHERQPNDPNIWRDDSVEIFLDPDHSHTLHDTSWIHLILSAGGYLLVERGPVNLNFVSGDDTFKFENLRTETEKSEEGWTARITIPWESLQIEPVDGKVIGFNLNRTEWPKEEYQGLFPTHGIFLAPDHWGHMVLAESGSTREEIEKFARHKIAEKHAAIRARQEELRSATLAPPPSAPKKIMETFPHHDSFGCEANPTGNPIGGGDTYSDIHTGGDFSVRNAEELIEAMSKAVAGQVVFVPDGVEIDLSGEETIPFPAGVTLAGTRGAEGSKGARIFNNSRRFTMFSTSGDSIRITGLRFEGQHGGPERLPLRGEFLDIRHHNTRVDNCEIFNFSGAGAITLREGASYAFIHHNYMHHIQAAS